MALRENQKSLNKNMLLSSFLLAVTLSWDQCVNDFGAADASVSDFELIMRSICSISFADGSARPT